MTVQHNQATAGADWPTEQKIANDLYSNFLVEASAGTGKTYSLVTRVVSLIKAGPANGGATMDRLVAITFTEAAAAELSDRIRSRMEQLLADHHPDDARDPDDAHDVLGPLSADERTRVETAIRNIDQATIQTIHGFAGQLLRKRPTDVGLPPGWLQLDDLAATQRFNESWERWLEWALGSNTGVSPDLHNVLRALIGARVGVRRWRDLARIFSDRYHHLRSDSSIESIDLPALAANAAEQLRALAAECSDPTDLLRTRINDAIATLDAAAAAAAGNDPDAVAQTLEEGAPIVPSGNAGARKNWPVSPTDVRAAFRRIGQAFQIAARSPHLIALLQELRRHFVIDFEAERKSDGVCTFDDLLVWGRDLLLNDGARRHFQRQYSHILIDEFQDTDPLQAEIAFYLASHPDADIQQHPWPSLPLSAGKLFLVGDSKQSIYRFRGADINVTNQVKSGGQLQILTLTENRRSQQPILDWVNARFAAIMVDNNPDGPPVQAEYLPLNPNAGIQRPGLGSVQVFGDPEPSPDPSEYGTALELQARHIANLIVTHASDSPQRRRVYDKGQQEIRPANFRDVCILLRFRTNLDSLLRALEDARVPFRMEGGSLLFDTQEVQDLLNCLHAIDDPTNQVPVAAALRSLAFACSDEDLLRWVAARGPWDYTSELLNDSDTGSERKQELWAVAPVWQAMTTLRQYHQRRHSAPVSRFISEFIRERRLEQLDLAEYRAREIWRRRQFLIDQARSFEAANPEDTGNSFWNLHRFLRWATSQHEENTRIAETTTPETDDDAVRIMTVHAAKGLEFPIVILPDSTRPQNNRGRPPVLFDADQGTAVCAVGSGGMSMESVGYADIFALETRHADAEAVRLQYVAATRARDHLFISRYATVRRAASANESEIAFANMPDDLPHTTAAVTADVILANQDSTPNGPPTAAPAYASQQWQANRSESIRHRSVQQAVTATWLARVAAGDSAPVPTPADQAVAVTAPSVDDKEAEPDQERPWKTGRGGTAFGRAVHGVMQDVVNRLSPQLPLFAGVKADDLSSIADPHIARLAALHASAEGLSSQQDEVASLVRDALRHPEMLNALQAPRRWTEISVAAPVQTSRGPVVIEGIIDLLYEDAAGQLVILDYKSDAVRNDADVDSKMAHYQYQGAAYAVAVETATGIPVKAVRFLFMRAGAVRQINDLPGLIRQIPKMIDSAP